MVLRAWASLVAAFTFLPQAPPLLPLQPFRVSGTVVDAQSGQVLAHVQVVLASRMLGSAEETLTTGDDGRFAFENLAAGHYALSAHRKGYIPQMYKQHEFFATALVVGPDLNSENLRFALRRTASLSGQIFDEMNEPVRNAQLLLFSQTLNFGRRETSREQEGSTDDRGHYHFGHLAAGTYFVGVVAQPWYARHPVRQATESIDAAAGETNHAPYNAPGLDVVYPLMFFPNAADLSSAAPITLHPGDAERADMTLRPIPALHLLIRLPSSDESEQLFVQQVTQQVASGIEQGLPAQTSQIAPGVFELSGLPPGRLNIGLGSSKGNETTTRSKTIQLASDAEINASDAPLSPAVGGVVEMDDGSPLSQQAYLQFHNVATGVTYDVQSGLHGEFTLQGQNLTPGRYGVTLTQPPASTVKSMSGNSGSISGHTVNIGSAQEVRLRIVITKGSGLVTGIALKDGKPLDGVMIVLVPQNPERNLEFFRRDQSDSDGSFNLEGILPGKYTVIAIENGWDMEWSNPAVLQKYLASGEPVEVGPNARIELRVNVQQ